MSTHPESAHDRSSINQSGMQRQPGKSQKQNTQGIMAAMAIIAALNLEAKGEVEL
jgi:hypothetical protein